MPSSTDTTQLLLDASDGDRAALDALWPHVYSELRQLAHARLRSHRPGETLNTTALVHEAYLRLVDGERGGWAGRAQFFALAARIMRFILVDYARAQGAQKRGGPQADLQLDGLQVSADKAIAERAADLLTLDRALDQIAAYDERLSQIVEYRFFGGLSYEEIAEVAGCSLSTAKRDWQRARTWLYRAMQGDDPGG